MRPEFRWKLGFEIGILRPRQSTCSLSNHGTNQCRSRTGQVANFAKRDNSILIYTPNCCRAGIEFNTQFCRIKGCGGAGWPPPPIIFERLKLPQQTIYRRKGNLSESPNHFKYRENTFFSRFYEQFSRSSRILGHFWKYEKISNS